jgi:callose synthase
MKSSSDHVEKRNYDDFNEFFWSRYCLGFRYSSETIGEDGVDVEGLGSMTGPLPGESLPAITEGLLNAPKTFLEKRSWLRGVLALNRLLEWHIVTFYLLGVIAFSRELIWGWVYSLQVASGVFWIFNSLHLLWNLLEVWGSFPGIQLNGTSVCGSIFTLVARFLILVYQTLYLMWAFSPQKGVYLGIEADTTFWWWQYVWLSLLCMVPYFVECIFQLWPVLSTRLYTSQNDYVQAFLNILYPLSRLYVGKEVHESAGHAAVYILFWATLITWKLFFSYIFEVYSMVLPTLQLTDDYLNYPNQSFAKMMFLLIMRWFPQFIVYLIDMSIWYAAWQAFCGTAVGFSDHIGDVRSIDDIRQNFGRAPENFCKKMLSPDAGSRRGSSASFLGGTSSQSLAHGEGASLLGADPHKLQSYVNRLLDVRIQKWVMFSAAWNEIIDHFRDEDIVSNTESDNLKFSRFDGFSQAIYLPVFQTAGVIENIMSELERPSEEYKDPKTGIVTDEEFFKPITGHVIMLTAVSEMWELGSYLFTQMLGPVHANDINAVMGAILKWSENGTLSEHVTCESVRGVMNNFVALIKIISNGLGKRKAAAKPRSSTKKAEVSKPIAKKSGFRRVVSATSLTSIDSESKPMTKTGFDPQFKSKSTEVIVDALRDQVRDKFRNMAHAMKGLVKDTDKDAESRDVVDRVTFLLSMENGFLWDDAYASDQLDDISRNVTYKAVLKKTFGLVACHPDDVEPKSKEVKRRLTFFVNTLFMDMPDAPSIHDMFSWNVLTPYYSEDVTYGKDDLEKRSDALGVSTLLYLQTLYRSDWTNFLERLGIVDEEKIWSKKFVDETRRWASIRAQTLSRTVNGMMYYEKALRLLASLERLDNDTTNDLMGEKFGYVVSCQVYGNMKRNQDRKADDIDHLMHRFPHLRVAYIDTVRLNRSGAAICYSVLVKSDRKGGIQEIYRVRLPGNPILGEGKPENQNHAMIFTRSEFLQTIDMNQEGYFEEALKMRNCLQEFAKREGPLPTTILGLREHIFTGSVSSLANYMALQEISFVTLGQRVLTRPLHIRLHYGHPDLFDKLFFITRGGISKSSKGINLSEDIFAGYNNVVRGGAVGFKEYLQVGKGRDVGMSQIYKFEAKLSQGAAEQSLSRDVYRMCNRLDFFRLLSFYYGGIGHYFSNVLTILTVYAVVYLMTLLAIFDLERIGDRLITPMGTIQMLLGGLGLLQTIPLFATLGVERGWWASIKEIFYVFATGGPLHFMFHIQTKATYMAQTILVGGAKYRPTGRGFVTQHTPFDELFRFFATSHLYLGVELAAGLILMGVYTDAGQYFGRTWSMWLASLSFLASPFWFNPLTFDWNVVTSDYDIWLRWMRCSTGGAAKSWSMWWVEENSFYKKMPLMSKSLYIIKAALYALVGEGLRRSDLFKSDITLNKPLVSVGNVLITIISLFVLSRVFTANERSLTYPVRRTIGIMLFIGIVVGVVTVFIEDTNCIRYALAAYFGLGAVCMLALLAGFKFVKHFYLIHDIVCGHIIFLPLFILAAFQLPHHIQTWLLYHNALSSDVVVSDILRYARKSQESGASGGGEPNEDLVEQVSELRKLVQKQEQLLTDAGITAGGRISTPTSGMGAPSVASSQIVAPQSGVSRSNSEGRNRPGYGRALSMSGIDVWTDMALGDVSGAQYAQQPHVETYETSSQPSGSQNAGFSFTQPDTMPPR